MSLLRSLLVFCVLVITAGCIGQPVDTSGVSSDTTSIRVATPLPADTLANFQSRSTAGRDTLDWRQRHSPRKATILSAVLPGAGQIYNRKYWKAPIVWAGFGVTYLFIRDNSSEYQRYRTAYLALVDDDPATVDEFNGRYSPSQVRQVMETYQRWRDISYIAMAGVYILNIIDASVDAHFVRFDVSPDLSMAIGPSLHAAGTGGAGLSFAFMLR